MTKLVLHHAWRSSASRRVRLCLEEKGLAYESHVVDLEKMEHHSPEYLKINPNGVIPALIHDGRALYESGTICEYLDDAFPEPPLRPAGAYERAEMRNWIRAARKPYTEEERAAARARLVQMLDRMEAAMKETGWLAGARYSIADIALVPFVKRIEEEIAPDEVTPARHPRVAAWWRAIQARPAFARAKIGPFLDPQQAG